MYVYIYIHTYIYIYLCMYNIYIYANMYMGNMDDPPDAQMGSKNLHEMANISRKPLRLMVHRSI